MNAPRRGARFLPRASSASQPNAPRAAALRLTTPQGPARGAGASAPFRFDYEPVRVDWFALERYALFERHRTLRPVTAGVLLKRLRFAERSGLDLGAFTVEAGYDFLQGQMARGITAHQHRNMVDVLNLVAEFAYGLRPFRPPKKPRRQLKFLTADQLDLLWSSRYATPSVDRLRRALLWFGLGTGLRVSEVVAMDRGDLDPAAGTVEVRHPAKGGERRTLRLEPWFFNPRRPLAAYLAARPEPARDREALWVGQGLVGAEVVPRRLTVDGAREVMHRFGRDAALPVPLSFTRTRHTCAMTLLRSGWPLEYVSKFLGHSSIAVTQHYADVLPDDMVKMMRRRPRPEPFS